MRRFLASAALSGAAWALVTAPVSAQGSDPVKREAVAPMGVTATTPKLDNPDTGDSCGLGPDIETRVAKVFTAADTVAYRGTLLIEYNNDREFVAITSADEQGRGSLLRLSREANGLPERVPLPPVSRGAPCALAPFYAFAVETGQVVAGRAAYRLTVRPRDTLRLGYVMDIDSALHVPLRVVTATADGQVLERFEFADITFFDAPVTLAQASEGVRPDYGFAALPPGFAVIDFGRTPVDYLVVSDGLAAVSVFVEPQPKALTEGEGVVLRGATIAYTRGTSDDRLITVLGEIPVTTARLLADAVRLEPVQ